MLEMAIIGGGIHGTFLSHALTRRTGLTHSDICVIDPHREPLHEWNRMTRNCGMRFLRSPSSHNMDVDFHALRDFARMSSKRHLAEFREPYARPALPLFQAHLSHLFQRHDLASMRRRGTVTAVELHRESVTIHTDEGSLEARHAAIAAGHSEHPHYPEWVQEMLEERSDAPIRHVFGRDFDPAWAERAAEPIVVGAGLSGCQLALATAERSGRPVTLLARQPLKVEHFDSNPCYIGPKCLQDFLRIPDYAERRATIQRERNPGTVPWDIFDDVQAAIRDGRIRFVVDEVASLHNRGESRIAVQLTRSGETLTTDRLLLATGFRRTPPAGALVEEIARRYELPQGPNGYPIPDSALRWHPRLFVVGPLGELELGPSCLNIIGAHHAARRIVPLFKDGQSSPAPWTPLAHLKP